MTGSDGPVRGPVSDPTTVTADDGLKSDIKQRTITVLIQVLRSGVLNKTNLNKFMHLVP